VIAYPQRHRSMIAAEVWLTIWQITAKQ
jgi:hypothetical protein